jgi:hydroxyacylglutathione hydrolase
VIVTPIPAFDDNYIWCLTNADTGYAVVVDPGDDDPVRAHLEEHALKLAAILVTHKHSDHTGGIRALLAEWPGIPVYGPKNEPIGTLTERVGEGDCLEIPEIQATFEVLDVPGHTEGHVAYLCGDRFFCGDTLFAAGCGRVFSGTHEQLHASLAKIAALPPQTRLYCAHEYTLDNLGFAEWVEPDSEAIRQRINRDSAARQRNEPTVPSLLSEELETNPFLRSHVPQVIAAAEHHAGRSLGRDVEVFTAIRTWKDRDYD